jgi:hypothetical protein
MVLLFVNTKNANDFVKIVTEMDCANMENKNVKNVFNSYYVNTINIKAVVKIVVVVHGVNIIN